MDESSWLNKLLSDPVAIATLLLALVTAVLAFAAFRSISQNNTLQKRERKERLLNEIIEWVTEIQEASLKGEIQVPSGKDVESVRATTIIYESNVLLRYGIPFSRNEYIRAIACQAFKKELQDEIENAISMFTIFLFLKGKSFGMEKAEQAFRGTYLKMIEEINKEIKTGHRTTEKLLQDYTEKLSYSTMILLTKIGNIMGSL